MDVRSEDYGELQRLVDSLFAPGVSSAATVSRCPPGVPLLCPGERITAAALAAAKGYGLEELEVVR